MRAVVALGLVGSMPAVLGAYIPRVRLPVARQDVGVVCTMWMSTTSENGTTCAAFADDWGLSVARLEALNPSLACPAVPDGSDGATALCIEGQLANERVSTTPDVAAAMAANVVSDVVSEATPTRVWPANTDVASFTVDFHAARAPTTRSFTPVVATPWPVLANTTSGCDAWYQPQKGDTCERVAANAGIEPADLLQWNPVLGSDCSGLYTRFFYCVHRPGAVTAAHGTSSPSVASFATSHLSVPTGITATASSA